MIVDTHIHSSYSRECPPDTCSPKLILRKAAKVGLDAICIADHDTLRGYQKARNIRREGDPLIFPAIEVSTSRGHLLAIGVERTWRKGVEPEEVVEDTREEGGLVSAPHPFYMSTISVSWLARELELAVEVYNAMASLLLYPNPAARKFAAKYGLPGTGGSDAHDHRLIGLGRTMADADDLDDFISQVAKGNGRVKGCRPPISYAFKFGSRSIWFMLCKLFRRRAP